jgi:EmrB/QacA subfamily drug resistance transporter
METAGDKATANKWMVFLAIGVGSMMGSLDSSIVNTILPVIRTAFKADVAGIEWVVTVYLLVVSGLLLSFGRLGDLRGHKSVYVYGFVIFITGSALCGLAPNQILLTVFRALQAIGAAILVSNAPAILTMTFPPSQRGQALGLQSTMTYIGLTAGPPLGGLLTARFGWRYVFYINVPICLIALTLSLRYIPHLKPAARAERFDLAGAATFIAGLVALLLALNQGQDWGWLSAAVLGLMAAAALLLFLFVQLELHRPDPMLDLGLFRSRLFSAAAATAVLNYVCLYTVLFLLPFYLIQGRGLGPDQAGLVMTVQPLVMAISAPISGWLSDRIGSRLLSTLGMAILAFGMFRLSRIGAASPLSSVTLGLGIVGLGTGTFIAPNTSALMGAAPRQRQGVAGGVLATARNVGMVLGVGLAGAIFTTVQAHERSAGQAAALLHGITAGFIVAMFIAAAGVVTSLVRGAAMPRLEEVQADRAA